MTDFTWPVDIVPFAQSFWLQPHVGGSESPFTRTTKTYGLSAPRWVSRMAFRGGYDGSEGLGLVGGRLDGFLAQIEGRLNRVRVWDFRRDTRTGSGGDLQDAPFLGVVYSFSDGTLFDDGFGFVTTWTGPPASEPAEEGATTMRWLGFVSGTRAFNVGDYVGGDGRAHIVADAPVVDGGGGVTVTFKPPLAAAVPAGAGIFTEVSSPFRLVADDAGSNMTEVGQATSYDVELVEDL
jgi:hypothetical protein